MKKLIWAIGIFTISAISLNAFAYSSNFTDGFKFENWYANSVEQMSDVGVIQGYPDGSFRPENNVNRAELAVMLDRLQQNIGESTSNPSVNSVTATELTQALNTLEQKLTTKFSSNSSGASNLQIENAVQYSLLAYDKYFSLNLDRNFKIYLVMAEAGMKKLSAQPDMTDLTKVTDVQLPAGYTLYEQPNIIFSYYLNYVGPKSEGDMIMNVNEWYGPFTIY